MVIVLEAFYTISIASMSNGSIEKIYNKAIKLLEGRFHSVSELKRKLEARGYSKDDVTSVLEKLKNQDYLNDERFAQIFFDNLIKYKTFGFYGLKAKLMHRGIDKEIIESLLQQLDIDQEIIIALRAVNKKRDKDPVKIARSLSAKGFRSEAVNKVLKVHLS
jgi:regulatory protein